MIVEGLRDAIARATLSTPRIPAIVFPTGYRCYVMVSSLWAAPFLADQTPRERWKTQDRHRRFQASLAAGRIRVER